MTTPCAECVKFDILMNRLNSDVVDSSDLMHGNWSRLRGEVRMARWEHWGTHTTTISRAHRRTEDVAPL